MSSSASAVIDEVKEAFPARRVVQFLPMVSSAQGDEPLRVIAAMGNNSANDAYTLRCKAEGLKIHPARYPRALSEFFIKMPTEEGDVVLDPFAGSNTTGAVAEELQRRWLAFDDVEEYLAASKFRFPGF